MTDALTEDSFSLGCCLRQAERTACRVIDGKAVVITIDTNELHVLNPVATRVWQLSDGRALSNVVEQIIGEFEVSRCQAEKDVVQFAREMLNLGALQVVESDPTQGFFLES